MFEGPNAHPPPPPLLFPTAVQDFVRKLLVVDQFKRMTAKEAMSHPWLAAADQMLAKHDLGQTLEYLKIYNAKRKFKAMIKTVSSKNSYFLCCVT